MRYRSSSIALSALAAAALLATGSLGEAVGQTRQKQIEMQPTTPTLQVKPATPGGGRPTGPGDIKSKPPGALPDFILEPGLPGNVSLGLPNSGFCKRKGPFGPADTVAFKVRFATNGTQAPTNGWGASQVTVAFNNAGTVAVALPSPSWNGTVPLEVDIPNGCYGVGGCQFTIKVDPANVVPETSNANNTTTKFCATPAG
jgi:hypothetical protein